MKISQGGWWLPVCLVAGVLAAQVFYSLPPPWLMAGAALLALSCFFKRRLFRLSLMVLACCWALFQFQLRLDDRLDPALSGSKIEVTGTVASIPSAASDYVKFRFDTDADAQAAGIPESLLVYWYREWPELRPGQRWRLKLRLKPPWGRVNFQGGDRERWFFANGYGGMGSVQEGRQLEVSGRMAMHVDRMRTAVMENIAGQVAENRQRAIVQALASADRSGIGNEHRRLLNVTGTAHLLAISGLHVGLAAAAGMWASRLLLLVLPGRILYRISFPIMVLTGLLCAAFYSALAGFGTPTVRSVLMLATAMSAVLLSRSIHPFRAWVLSMAIIALVDPFSLLQPGFWYSYLAVASLLLVFIPRTGNFNFLQSALAGQGAVIIVLVPVSALVFNSFSGSAFFANLLAIPWVSLLVVPLVLSGLVVSLFSVAGAGVPWRLAGDASGILFRFLETVDDLQGELIILSPPGGLQVLLALLGAFVLLLPRGVPWRWMAVFLLIPLFARPGPRTGEHVLEIEILDAGQGTAVVLNAGGRTLLYDTGPGDGEGFDLVNSVIEPALAMRGPESLEQIIISHGDMDHAGGLGSLIDSHRQASFMGNFAAPAAGVTPCVVPATWSWPGVSFEVLHPAPGLPYLGNDSSCVLSVQAGRHSALLTGDISRQVENRLLQENVSRHAFLLVPHHGSKSSSSNGFIRQVDPDLAVATASLGNRFGFPRADTRGRYEFRGTRFLSTGECGAIRLRLFPDGGMEARSARRVKNRAWRWPAAGNCP